MCHAVVVFNHTGGLPFIKSGPQIVSEFDSIVDFISLKVKYKFDIQ